MDTIISNISQALVNQSCEHIDDFEQLALEIPGLRERIDATIVDIEHRANWYDGLNAVNTNTHLPALLLMTM